MQTRKSGIFALILGVAFLGACEDKDEIVFPTPTVPVTLTIAPDPVPALNPGQTVQLIAIVGGSSNQAVTWTTSDQTVATVSATGLVTASTTARTTTGVAVISAVSAADANARDAVTISVNPTPTQPPPPPPPGPPSVSIAQTNVGGTLVPVNPTAVAGVIDVVANVRVPAGSTANRLQIDIVSGADTSVMILANACQQTITNPTTGADNNVTIVCSVNTAQLDANGIAQLVNGTYKVVARVCTTGTGVCTAATTLNSAFSQNLVFNNADILMMTVRTDLMNPAGPRQDINGLSWFGNAPVIVDIRPAIYSTTQASPLGSITSMNVSLGTELATSAGTLGVSSEWFCGGDPDGDGVAEIVDPDGGACAPAVSTVAAVSAGTNLFRATFPQGTAIGAGGSGGVEDPNIVIAPSSVLTVSGNNFPIIAPNTPGMVATYAVVFPSSGSVVPVPVTAQNPLRLDNLAPRVTAFDISNAATALNCAPLPGCYVNDGFQFAAGAPSAATPGIVTGGTFSSGSAAFRMVDFGVDRQTAAFDIVDAATGATVKAGAQGTVTTPAGVAESATSGAYVVRAVTVDALGNSSTRFAPGGNVVTEGNTASVVGSATVAGAQTIGVDRTQPVMLSAVLGPAGSLVTPLGVALTTTNGTDASEAATTLTVTFRDTSVAPAGPSGFSTTPLAGQVAVRVFNAATGTAGLAFAIADPVCGPLSATSSGCTITVPDAGTNGYYQITTTVRDVSFPGGNVSSPSTTVLWLDDETAPVVAGVTAPSTIAPNTAYTFGADMSDNVELGDNLMSFGYPNVTAGPVNFYAHQLRKPIGEFGPTALTASATATSAEGSITTTPIFNVQSVGGGCFVDANGDGVNDIPFPTSCPVNGAGDNGIVTAVNMAIRDMAGVRVATICPAPGVDGAVTQGGSTLTTQGIAAVAPNGSCTQRQNNSITPNVIAGGGTAFNFGTIANLYDFVQNDVCRGTAPIFGRTTTTSGAGGFTCAAAPTGTVVTLQAEAHGAQGQLANPFPEGVRFYILDPSGRWVVIDAGAVTVQVFDDDVLAVRRWIYTASTTTTVVPIGSTVRAVGIRGNAALVANTTDRVVP